MKPILSLVLLTCLFSSCAKDAVEVAQEAGVLPSTCGTDGARLQANTGDGEFCASAQVMAVGDGTSVMISGFDLGGSSIVLQVDTLGAGVHPITEAENALLYMQMGATFATGQNSAGELTIVLHDEAGRRLKGGFEADLINAQNGQVRTVSGTFDVTYSIEG
ncbi:MAG: hypothetical protein R2817_06040 [Flavobacteriales bacterium]